jgi:hypothetical protein
MSALCCISAHPNSAAVGVRLPLQLWSSSGDVGLSSSLPRTRAPGPQPMTARRFHGRRRIARIERGAAGGAGVSASGLAGALLALVGCLSRL